MYGLEPASQPSLVRLYLPIDGEMVQCKRTGLRSQFRAGVGPLLPLESERCPAFLRPGLMVRANALHYALRIRTLLSTMQRFGVLRERQTHKPMAWLPGRATTLLAGKK